MSNLPFSIKLNKKMKIVDCYVPVDDDIQDFNYFLKEWNPDMMRWLADCKLEKKEGVIVLTPAELESLFSRLYERIEHGDETQRTWLKDNIEAYIKSLLPENKKVSFDEFNENIRQI